MESLYKRFDSRLSAIEPGGFNTDPFEGTGLNPEDMSQRELDEFFRDLNRIDPADLPKLAELQAEELDLAKVVVGCDGGPLNEQFFLGSIRTEYEQEFLDNNAAAVEEFTSGG